MRLNEQGVDFLQRLLHTCIVQESQRLVSVIDERRDLFVEKGN